MKLSVHWAQNEDLLVDNLDAQRLGWANYAFDDGFEGGIPHFEALILGFRLGNLIHCPHRHHPRCLVAFTQKRFQNVNIHRKEKKVEIEKFGTKEDKVDVCVYALEINSWHKAGDCLEH